MKWVELKHFQHGYLCLEHIYYWTSAIIKMRFGWCWNTFNICENLCLEHVCYWTSAVLKHIYHYQKSVWVPETPVGAIQYLFRGSIDALVLKHCQIGKQKCCIQCSNIVWKDGLKHSTIQPVWSGRISKRLGLGHWNILSLCYMKMLISNIFGAKCWNILSLCHLEVFQDIGGC